MQVKLIDNMGTDLDVVNAARVSFNKTSDWEYGDEISEQDRYTDGSYARSYSTYTPIIGLKDRDKKLIKYLAEHNHWSPFSHCIAKFHIKAPIFVARQLAKHQVGFSWNEVSRRYVDSEPEFYKPDRWRLKADNVKQGSSKENIAFINGKFKRHNTGNKNFDRMPITTKFNNMKARAKREGIIWDINIDDLCWYEKCPILGIELDYTLGNGIITDASPSIDRIDLSKGYIKDNCMIISHKANTMKSSASIEELITFSRSMLLQYKGEISSGISIDDYYMRCVALYKHMINDLNICAEQARMVLPQSMYTEWIMTGSLYAWARLCNLRLKEDTQLETRIIAQGISEEMAKLYPESWKVLVK